MLRVAAATAMTAGIMTGDTQDRIGGKEIPAQVSHDIEAVNQFEIRKDVGAVLDWYDENKLRLPYLYSLVFEQELPKVLADDFQRKNVFQALGVAKKFGIPVQNSLEPQGNSRMLWYADTKRMNQLRAALDEKGKERMGRLKPDIQNFQTDNLAALANPDFDMVVDEATQRSVPLDLGAVKLLLSIPKEQRDEIFTVMSKIGPNISAQDLFQSDRTKIPERLALLDDETLNTIKALAPLPVYWWSFFHDGLDNKNFPRVIAAIRKPEFVSALQGIFGDVRLQEARIGSGRWEYYDLLLKKSHGNAQVVTNIHRMLTACPDDFLHQCAEALSVLRSSHVLDARFVEFFVTKLRTRDAKATKHTFFGIIDSIAGEYVRETTGHSTQDIIKSPELFLKLVSESQPPSALFEFLMVQDANFFTAVTANMALNTAPEALLALTSRQNFDAHLMVRFFAHINPGDRRTRAFASIWYDGGILKGTAASEHSLKGKADKEHGSIKNLFLQDPRIDWYTFSTAKRAFEQLGLLQKFKEDIGGEEGLAELEKHFEDLK